VRSPHYIMPSQIQNDLTYMSRFYFLTYHANMTTRIHFIEIVAIIFFAISTNKADASLRGLPTVEAFPRFECPTETPAIGTSCQFGDDDESATCYFNFVKTPGPSPELNNFVPSISCSCRNEHWECGVAPEYLKALVEAASG
jgi:hypothetical protein